MDMSEDALLKQQYQRAKELQVFIFPIPPAAQSYLGVNVPLMCITHSSLCRVQLVDRAMDREIRLKEKHLLSHGGMFRFVDFGGIRNSVEYVPSLPFSRTLGFAFSYP